jgi:Dolichyl-phosphate-mannose-protein mannosyltransferase
LRNDQRALRRLCLAGLICVCVFALWTGLSGLDFGYHWDERKLLSPLEKQWPSRLLPGWYNYPSLTYDLTLLVSAVAGTSLIACRAAALVITLAACPIVYWLVMKWRRNPIAALFAAATLATSWELAYHARWLAPDGVMMSLAAATMSVAFVAVESPQRWLKVAAFLAGLTASAKYPGGIMIVPVLSAAWLTQSATEARDRPVFIRQVLVLSGCFLLAFIFTTPGAIIQPRAFISDVRFEMMHYGVMGHGGYGVTPGAQHAHLLLSYLSLAAMSSTSGIAVCWFVVAAIGLFVVIRTERRTAMIIVLPVVLYTAYMIMQRVMIVRNYLVLLPFVSIMAARGLECILAALRVPPLRRTVAIVAGVLVAFDAVDTAKAADSVATRRELKLSVVVSTYLARHRDEPFELSSQVRQMVSRGVDQQIVSCGSSQVGKLLLLQSEISESNAAANQHGRYDLIAGPREVNLDYYPSWRGDDHVVAVSCREAPRFR